MPLTNQTPTKEVNQIFDTIATDYDKMNNVISLGLHERWRKKATRLSQIKKGDKILDVCCGTGDWSLSLADYVGANGQVTGLDFSHEMLKVAAQKIKRSKSRNIHLIEADAQALPFPDASFDAAVIGFGLRNVPDASLVLEEMLRVIKPGGQVLVLETSQPQQPLIHFGWKLYMEKIIPWLGSTVKHRGEYHYLQSSTQKFLTPQALDQLFLTNGYHKVTHKALLLGSAMIHWGDKNR